MIDSTNSTTLGVQALPVPAEPLTGAEDSAFLRIREEYSRELVLPYPDYAPQLPAPGVSPALLGGFVEVIGRLVEMLQGLLGKVLANGQPSPNAQPSGQPQTAAQPATATQPKTAATGVTAPPNTEAKAGLTAAIEKLFGPNRKAVSEEQLQAAVVYDQLSKENPAAAEKFLGAFKHERRKLKGQDDRVENSVKLALQKVVDAGLLDTAKARQIQGLANQVAEFDGKKGRSDAKEGTLVTDAAVGKAEQTLQQIQSGALPPPPPASLKPSTTETAKEKPAPGSSETTKDPEFLWKPVSDSDGKLAVLLPSKYTGKIKELAIYSALPPSSENLVERGRYSGVGNGDRTHFRFSKPGAGYPNGVYVVATLDDGSTIQFKINNTSQRS